MRRKNEAGFTLFEALIVVFLLFVAITIGTVGWIEFNWSSGTGEKIGQVVKLSKQGFRCKTWEGQLIRGGINDGSGSFGTVPFNFTVEDDRLVERVERYMREQTEVVVKYRIEGLYRYCRSESDGHFLESIEPVKKPAEAPAR